MGIARLHPLVREFSQRLVKQWRDQGQGLKEQAGTRLAVELTDLGKLEARTRAVGYWGCLEQVRAALAYAGLLGTEWRVPLARMERCLDRESHLLASGKWWPEPHASFFFQQLFNRAVEEGLPLTSDHAPERWVRQEVQVGAEDRALLRVLTGHQDDVTSVAFSPDGTRLLTGSDDGTARVWDAASGQALRILVLLPYLA